MFLKRFLHLLPGGPFADGLHAYNEGDYERACDLFRALVVQTTGREREKAAFHLSEACLQAAERLVEEGRREPAVELYREALALHPEYADAHNRLGENLLVLGRRMEARKEFQAALARNPRFVRARVNLVRCLVAGGDPATALEGLLELQKQSPPLLREQVRELYRRCREGDLAEMQAALEAFDAGRPDELELRKAQALEAIQRNDNGLAISLLAQLLAEHEEYADLHHLLGLAYGNAGLLDDAILEFRRALTLNPNLTKARINLGVSLLESGRLAEAAAELRAAEAEEPYHPLVLNALRELSALTEA